MYQNLAKLFVMEICGKSQQHETDVMNPRILHQIEQEANKIVSIDITSEHIMRQDFAVHH
ncbi:hypothetical protein KIN20_000089 [Parelaphostrongylus tenuis]|uniref:Uncharacterized protein n=1 Tax=Parelaphostrongylus tenuis TaxID=148309 RepID=A0AAD5LUW8_PARTN|nr:hypothetical protein KIN20_000089 [Parelaphostrongylus tenuis]